MIINNIPPTMHKKNSYFVVNLGSIAHIGLRQIYRFDYLDSGKFGSLSYRNEIALYNATFSYAYRCVQFNIVPTIEI